MLKSIKYCLSHLADFSGRDARQTFWFYVLFLFIIQYAVSIIAVLPMMVAMFGNAFEAASNGVEPDAMSAAMMGDMMGYMETQMWVSVVIGLVMTALFVAAFVRRLHDAGFSGWIAAVPVVTQIVSLVYSIYALDAIMAAMPEIMADAATGGAGANPMLAQLEAAPLSLIGWIGYLVVIGFGVIKSQDGPNQYGDAPVRF